MDTSALKKFAQAARRSLMEQVAAKLTGVLLQNSPARRESPKAVAELEKAIDQRGQEQVVERVAYIWFNRFCALRFMDVNHYSRVGVVSPAEGQFQPEILGEAKMGHIDEDMVANAAARERVFDLLRGKITSNDPQGEAYRLLLVAVCNYWHKTMPFMFERIHDYAELLMPDDLLSESSILAQTREAMTEENCEDVEVIGWLYQFYISEKKDAVFEGLKKNKKVTPENIPAATQLFTPHWIVRYLVENSLGRLWMLNRPKSGLAGKMDYYIKPEQPETDFLRVNAPEDIKICDPACGSGHMLTYAFDLLYAIYEEEGYAVSEIPEKILTQNLYGVEIDERAGALAAFALTMKARKKQRGFFRNPVQPKICVLQNVIFEDGELARYMDFIGHDLFTAPLVTALRQFEEADNFGSLIRPEITDAAGMHKILENKDVGRNMLLQPTHEKVLRVLKQSEYLSPRYHVVIANPPYMGGKGMNARLGAWAKDNYPNSKSDLFAMFIERIVFLLMPKGYTGLMTPFTWMFLSSYETLRNELLVNRSIIGLVRPEYHAFFDSAYVPICAFVILSASTDTQGLFIDLNEFYGANIQKVKLLEALHNYNCGWRFVTNPKNFLKIAGSPIAYWASENVLKLFDHNQPIENFASAKQGLITGDNERFLKYWSEISLGNIGFCCHDRNEANLSQKTWFPHHKGGAFRKWYGNHEYIVDWHNDGQNIRNFYDEKGKLRSRPQNMEFYFKPAITWTSLTVSSFSARLSRCGFIYDAKGPLLSPIENNCLLPLAGQLNSCVSNQLLKILAPTMDYNQGPVSKLPCPKMDDTQISQVTNLVNLLELHAKSDWDSYETSWDFTILPLLSADYHQLALANTYTALRAHWRGMTLEMQRLEEENNRIFIEAYGLQDELTPDVPLKEITLTCNPHYRYGNDKTEDELEAQLLADTMREFISYAVGCMFGRYSLDAPGLILANQADNIEDFSLHLNEACGWGIPTHEDADPHDLFEATLERCRFLPDEDNVIPILDGDWFTDDITGRFREFLRVTFGEEHYEENLAFIEDSLGKDIRKYFIKDFYNDHVKRYKKRPIYWLFSSPKGSFNALIYMHRYTPHTVSVVMNDYLREFQTKLATEKALQETIEASASSSPAEKARATKKLDVIRKTIKELEDYERDTLYPLATRQIEIDLDDGVKANYPKFGAALKKIPGLDAKEE
ncbi:MAG: BREX-1 system adenine-specific DNA-methyltransferase PglX [Desulfovibrio sp.]|jgi:hypothetical protein|nr:BREX-1 system adenine-specific DNA-methyltransferase PglX [Desulfovibrio sp.]